MTVYKFLGHRVFKYANYNYCLFIVLLYLFTQELNRKDTGMPNIKEEEKTEPEG